MSRTSSSSSPICMDIVPLNRTDKLERQRRSNGSLLSARSIFKLMSSSWPDCVMSLLPRCPRAASSEWIVRASSALVESCQLGYVDARFQDHPQSNAKHATHLYWNALQSNKNNSWRSFNYGRTMQTSDPNVYTCLLTAALDEALRASKVSLLAP